MGDKMIPLVKDTIDNKDIDRLIEWLKTYPHLTKGELTIKYEELWARMLGCKYSVFVNSGSSANLLMLYSLIEAGRLQRGDKVVVPAVSWSTDLAPVVQLGLKPVLCDCNLDSLSIDIEYFEKLIEEEKPKALILVSVLGLVPKMGDLAELCERNGVILLEDACESLGSEHHFKKLGTFGLMSSFSTYFGHHISTIEGGMVCTDDEEIFNILKSIRSHGWDRDLDPTHRDQLRKKYQVKEFQSLYTFYHHGFNMRATDLQAFLGIEQLKKIDLIVEKRNSNYNLYNRNIQNDFWMPPISNSERYVSSFAYPIIHPNRDLIVEALRENRIAARPLICGSLGRQPFWVRENGILPFKNADVVDKYGLYLPNNHQISNAEIERICGVVNGAMKDK